MREQMSYTNVPMLFAIALVIFGVWKIYSENKEEGNSKKVFFRRLGLVLLGTYILIAGTLFLFL